MWLRRVWDAGLSMFVLGAPVGLACAPLVRMVFVFVHGAR